MGDIEVIGRIVIGQAGVLITLGVGILVLVPVATMCARRCGWSRTRTVCAALAGASLALVPATTLARGDVLMGWGRSCAIQPGLSLASPEAVLNALLFVPAAFFGVLALRRAMSIVLAALACSAAVEGMQLVTALGTCQTADVVRNVLGALATSGAAVLLVRASLPKATASEAEPDPGQ